MLLFLPIPNYLIDFFSCSPTDTGIVLKVITIYNQDTESMEEVILEELQVFKVSEPSTPGF